MHDKRVDTRSFNKGVMPPPPYTGNLSIIMVWNLHSQRLFALGRLVSKGLVQSSVGVATSGSDATMLLNRWSAGEAGKVFAFGHVRNRPATG
jgi:hypothetical protein